jgi:hypothetical protein
MKPRKIKIVRRELSPKEKLKKRKDTKKLKKEAMRIGRLYGKEYLYSISDDVERRFKITRQGDASLLEKKSIEALGEEEQEKTIFSKLFVEDLFPIEIDSKKKKRLYEKYLNSQNYLSAKEIFNKLKKYQTRLKPGKQIAILFSRDSWEKNTKRSVYVIPKIKNIGEYDSLLKIKNKKFKKIILFCNLQSHLL